MEVLLVLFVIGPAHGGQPELVMAGSRLGSYPCVLHLSVIEPAASKGGSKGPEVMAPLLL